MHGFLTRRHRPLAWLGFIASAVNAPVAATVLDDASWLFSGCVATMAATVILIDDRMRRMGDARRRMFE
jgi:hypothetical protein